METRTTTTHIFKLPSGLEIRLTNAEQEDLDYLEGIEKLRIELEKARYENVIKYGTSHPEMYKTELDYAKEGLQQARELLANQTSYIKELQQINLDLNKKVTNVKT